MKIVPADPGEPEEHRRRSEAQLLASLNHPALVTLFDAVVLPGRTCLVMELVEGGTLHGRLLRGPLDEEALAVLGADLAGGLAFMHAHGVVHRDVKPSNVLLTAGAAHAKLSDFGIAKLLDTDPARSGELLGTARYVSPEQARGSAVGPATDVYSLGLTLLEAATGRVAFPGTPAASLTARLLREPEVPPQLGYAWRSLLTAATAREPGARPSADEVVDRLTALTPRRAAAAPGAPTSDTQPIRLAATATAVLPGPAARPGRRPARRLAVVAAAIGLLVAGGVTIATSLGGGEHAALRPSSPSAVAPPSSATTEPTHASTTPAPSTTSGGIASTAPSSGAGVGAAPTGPGQGNGRGRGNGNGNGNGNGRGKG